MKKNKKSVYHTLCRLGMFFLVFCSIAHGEYACGANRQIPESTGYLQVASVMHRESQLIGNIAGDSDLLIPVLAPVPMTVGLLFILAMLRKDEGD